MSSRRWSWGPGAKIVVNDLEVESGHCNVYLDDKVAAVTPTQDLAQEIVRAMNDLPQYREPTEVQPE